MQQAKRLSLALLISLLVHSSVVGALLWNWQESDDSANNHIGELATTISMEMLQGMRIEEPESEPTPQKSEPEPELKEEIVADPTKKPESEKKKQPENKQEKPKPPKEKPKKQVQQSEKPQKLPQHLPVGERNVNSASVVNSKATTIGAAVNTNANMVGSGSNTNEIAAYRAALYREIERRKEYPTRAKMMRKQGIAYVSFSVGHDGSLSGENLVKSSGDESLDKAALKAVKRARSVGPKPNGFESRVSIPIRFSLQ